MGKIEIITDKHTLVINLRDDRKFIISEPIDRSNKTRLEDMQTRVCDSFTDKPLTKTPLSSNHKQIISQLFILPLNTFVLIFKLDYTLNFTYSNSIFKIIT